MQTRNIGISVGRKDGKWVIGGRYIFKIHFALFKKKCILKQSFLPHCNDGTANENTSLSNKVESNCIEITGVQEYESKANLWNIAILLEEVYC